MQGAGAQLFVYIHTDNVYKMSVFVCVPTRMYTYFVTRQFRAKMTNYENFNRQIILYSCLEIPEHCSDISTYRESRQVHGYNKFVILTNLFGNMANIFVLR